MLTNIVLFLIIAVGILVFGSALYAYIRNKTLEEIREDVYKLFLEAEHMYTASGSGKQKMKWVVSMARMMLPDWAQVLITEDLLYRVIQGWFTAVKDLLDDGKYNNSVKTNTQDNAKAGTFVSGKLTY